MKRRNKRIWLIIFIIVTLLTVVAAVIISWFLFDKDIFNNPLAKRSFLPVVCSLRGCITAKTWSDYWQVQQSFAEISGQNDVRPVDALTTAVRQRLVEYSIVHPVVNKKDAIKYRQEILRINDEDKVKEVTGLDIDKYDDMVVLPLLQQEALRQQLKVESLDELYRLLAKDRWVVALPASLRWDKGQAQVVEK